MYLINFWETIWFYFLISYQKNEADQDFSEF